MRRTRGGRALGVVLALAGALVAAGCAHSGFPGSAPCLPARMHADPAVTGVGEVVTVSAAPTDCDLGYGPGHRYTIRVRAVRVASPPITVTVDTDGRFSAAVPIPADFPQGPATIEVEGSPYDECGKNGYGSCAGYGVPIEIR